MKPFGKFLFILLILILIIAGVWYFNNNFLAPTEAPKVTLPIKVEKPAATSTLKITNQSIILASNKEVLELDPQDNTSKIIFSDQNETNKIQALAGITAKSNELFAVSGEQKNLVVVKLDGVSKSEILISDFGLPSAIVPSSDGKTIATVTFSNAERNYGFNLNVMSRSGENAQSIVTSEEEIANLVWSDDAGKIYYTQVKDSKTDISSYDFKLGKAAVLYSTDKNIQGLSFSQDKLYFIQTATGITGSQIFELTSSGEAKKFFETKTEIKDMQISTDNTNIIYTSGKELFIADIKGENFKKLASNVRIYKWK